MTVELRKIVKRAYSCTCHIPTDSRFGRHDVDPRPIVLLDGSTEWQHADDATYARTIHAHVERYATDCDGAHGSSGVNLPNEDEDEWDFWHRVVSFTMSAHRAGTLTLTGEDNAMVADWSAGTEEGHESETATECHDPNCAYDKSSQYDQFAELAGY